MRQVLASMVVALALAAPARAMTPGAAIKAVFGKHHAKQARCIARAESHLNRFAVSPTSDYGVFQINGPSWFGKVIRFRHRRMRVSRSYIFRPLDNARAAWIISKGGTNWAPWSTYTRLGLCHGL